MKKIFAIVCIVLILAFSSLTCFANNSDVIQQVDGLYPFFDLNWEAISLNHIQGVNISQGTIDDIVLYSIDNVFSADTRPVNSDDYIFRTVVASNNSINVMNPDGYVFTQQSSVHSSTSSVQGVAGGNNSVSSENGVLTTGLRCGSVFNLFKSPNLKFAQINDQIDMDTYNSYIYVSFIVPEFLYYNIRDGLYEEFYDLTWHFSAEVAHADSEEVFFTRETYDVSFGKYFDSNNVSLSRLFTYNGLDADCNSSNLVGYFPSGFIPMTVRVPLGDFLYNISYEHSIDDYEFYGCFYRNLEFYPTFTVYNDYLSGVLNINAEMFGDSPYIQQYFDLIGTGLYFPVVNKTRCLPIYSVYTRYSNVSTDVQAENLDRFNEYFNGITYETVSLDDFNLVDWLGDTLGGVFDVELIPGISISTITIVVLGLGLLFIILKFFVGG